MAKTTRRVRVALGEALRPVGEIVFETDGRRETCMFRYAAEWLDDPGRFAIAPTMPLAGTPFYSAASRERPRSALPGPIADGAPDSWGRGLIRKALPRAAGMTPAEIAIYEPAFDHHESRIARRMTRER